VLSLRERGISDIGLLRALETVPRELFAPRRFGDLARSDVALPLPCGQTMSSPATVAVMLAALGARPGAHVLEIGAGSGYVAAILARMGAFVHSFECRPILAESARQRLADAGFANVVALVCGDGLSDVPEGLRYDRIVVNGILPDVPAHLSSRLRVGGRLVRAVPGPKGLRLAVLTRTDSGELRQFTGAAVRVSALVADRPTDVASPSRNGALT
jgi:protein-L-isoaspartate(D-aspartate) O-methyltransferase